MCIGYYISGVLVPKFQERGLSVLHQKKKRRNSSKRAEEILASIKEEGFTAAVLDESISFLHDVLVVRRRKIWVPKGMRPVGYH